VALGIEGPAAWRLSLNGKPVPPADAGWWVDPAIRRIPLPAGLLEKGPNVLEAECEFHDLVDIETLYLLGGFGVRVEGTRKILTTLPGRLAPGDLAKQGLPFYGAARTLRIPVDRTPAAGERLFVEIPKVSAACAKVMAAGREPRVLAWQPYEADVTEDIAASGGFDLEVVLTRRNTFGPLHQVPLIDGAYGPGNFTTEGGGWSQAYMLMPSGLLEPPRLSGRTGR
jgi:hypothetical protein